MIAITTNDIPYYRYTSHVIRTGHVLIIVTCRQYGICKLDIVSNNLLLLDY